MKDPEIELKRRLFSSPFIEERLYLMKSQKNITIAMSSRPLLSRSGCISIETIETIEQLDEFSSPFIEERLYLMLKENNESLRSVVLVPFYRGAVVFPIH